MNKDKEYYNNLDKNSPEYIAYAKFNKIGNSKQFNKDLKEFEDKLASKISKNYKTALDKHFENILIRGEGVDDTLRGIVKEAFNLDKRLIDGICTFDKESLIEWSKDNK